MARAIVTSSAVTPATAAIPTPMLSLLFGPAWAARVARSSASPATRPHNHGVRFLARKSPTPVAISRTPYKNNNPPLCGMPSARPSKRGANISAAPKPILNQPRPRAVTSLIGRPLPYELEFFLNNSSLHHPLSRVASAAPILSRLHNHLDTAVLFFAKR